MEDKRKVRVSLNNPSIQRINERCINCGVCFNTCEKIVGIDHTLEKEEPLCINCGQCILTCPKASLVEKYNYKKVLNLIKDTNKIVTISVAPAIRSSLGEELGLGEGVNLEGLLPSILRKLGFTYVFDVTLGADGTVMEEAHELLERLKSKNNLPMFTSCCPAWVKYVKMFHPELLDHLSTTKSPIGIQSTLIKTYFKEMSFIDSDIISVVVAPCTAKKEEIIGSNTDYIITTRELSLMIKECNIDINALRPSVFDSPLGSGSRAGTIFGRSGGVCEAVLETFYHMVLGKTPKIDMFNIKCDTGFTKESYKIGDYILNVLVISGLPNLKLIDNLDKYDFIEVMNCHSGCIGGGGQPLGSKAQEDSRYENRTTVLNSIDKVNAYSYQNEELCHIYDTYLNHVGSTLAKELLHIDHKR